MTVNFDHPLTYVELDVELTTLKDGFGACTPSGNWQCFSPATAANNNSVDHRVDAHTYRFNVPSKFHPISRYSIPNIDSIEVTPPSLDIGVSLGIRLSGSVTFSNHPYGDSDIDRHAADRDYNPYDRGTFWGKFTARLPFIRGNKIRILRGFEGQDLADYTTQHLIVDAYSGNSSGSQFTIKFVDIFRWLDDKQAQAPRASLGRLSADINDSETLITLIPSGICDQVNPITGLTEYPLSGLGSIGEEEVYFTRSGDNLTLSRGEFDTDPVEHSADDSFQLTLEYSPQSSANIIYDLIKNYTNIDDSVYIDKPAWDAQEVDFIGRLYSTRLPRPESVKTLINELIEQVGLMVYQDEIKQEIIYSSVKSVSPSSSVINSDVIHDVGFSKIEQDSKIVTQVWTYYNRKSAFKKINDESNYDSILSNVGSLTAVPVTSIKKIFSRWIPKNGYDTAARTNSLILSRFQFPPRKFNFILYDDNNQHAMGNGYFLETDRIENAYGVGTKVPIQITRINRKSAGVFIESEEMRLQHDPVFGVEGDKNLTITSDTTDVNLREYFDTFYYPPESGDTIVFHLLSGARTGGDIGINAGDWPEPGLNLKLNIYGKALGRGGNGAGPDGSGILALSGGTALYTRVPITVNNEGLIGAGGGGGGGITWWVNVSTFGSSMEKLHAFGAGGAGFPPGNSGPFYKPWPGGVDQGFTDSGSDELGGAGHIYILNPYSDPENIHYGYGGDLSADGVDGIFIPVFEFPDTGVISPAGSAGVAVDGDSFITWENEGTIIGSRIN